MGIETDISNLLANEIKRKLKNPEAVEFSYPHSIHGKNYHKILGLENETKTMQFIIDAKFSLMDESEYRKRELDEVRLLWLYEQEMRAGQFEFRNYAFSGWNFKNDFVCFENGDDYGNDLSGKEYISKWKETGGITYFPGTMSLENEEINNIVANFGRSTSSHKLTDALFNCYLEDEGAEKLSVVISHS